MHTTYDSFDELPDQVQADLIDWYNRSEVDDEDKERLLNLYNSGRFIAWTCACGTRCYYADPKNWDYFQGTCNVDYSSYPGSPEHYTYNTIVLQCDECRRSLPELPVLDDDYPPHPLCACF